MRADGGNLRDGIDLGGAAAALNRNKRLIAATTLAFAAAALLFCALVAPRYVAQSRILIENQESYFTRSDSDAARGAEAVNSQIQLLTSRDLARKAVEALVLQGNPEFDPPARDPGLRAPLVWLGVLPDPAGQTQEDRVLANYFDRLAVTSPAGTRVLQVEFSSRDPDLAARGANTVADLYMDLQTQARRERAHQAAQSLKPALAALEARAAEADARVAAFRAEKIQNAGNATMPGQQLGEIAAGLAEARTAQSEAESKARTLRELLRQGRLAEAGEISTNEPVRRISEQRAVVRSQLAADSRTLLPAHPRIKELQAQLFEIDTDLRAAVEKAARGLDNDARAAGARVANLAERMEEQKRAAAASNAEAAQLRDLERDARALHDQVASEAAKYEAARSRESVESAPDARIVSRALSPSQPVFPKKIPIVVFAALAGLFLSAGAVILRAMTRPRGASRVAPPPPREPEELFSRAEPEPPAPAPIQDLAGMERIKQALAEFCAPVAPEPENPVAEEPAPLSARAAASRALVERIVRATKSRGAHVLIATDGDSAPACASLTLARLLAREGRAILLQTDDSDPFLNEALEVAASGACDAAPPGLAHLLNGDASFSDAIYRDDASRLHIVQAGGPVDLLSTDLSLILDALQATYDFVVIAAGADEAARELAAESDLTLIFAEDRQTLDFLHDDFEASGVRPIVLAGLDRSGEIVEIAA